MQPQEQGIWGRIKSSFGFGRPDTNGKSHAEPRAEPRQLDLPESEQRLLEERIREDIRIAWDGHRNRIAKFVSYQNAWRGKVGGAEGEQGKSNFEFPLIPAEVFTRIAKIVEGLFGEDAQVIANPTEPTDNESVAKVGVYMQWLVFNLMKLINPYCVFLFKMLMQGRARAYAPYRRHFYNHPTKGRVLYKESPEFLPCDEDDLFEPPDEVNSLQDFRFFIQRHFETPDALLRGEAAGIYAGISDDWEEILRVARDTNPRMSDTQLAGNSPIKALQDEEEGVSRGTVDHPGRELIEVWSWYGKWRMLEASEEELNTNHIEQSSGDTGVNANLVPAAPDTGKRGMHESDILLHYLPGLRKIKGGNDLAELYPDTPNKRPFVEDSLIKDGSYWSPGLPELLFSIKEELTKNYNLRTEAGTRAISPIGFYNPASGFDPDKDECKYEPGKWYPTTDASSVKIFQFQADMRYSILQEQGLMAIKERLIGNTDLSSGRSIDRANAPKTVGGTIALLQAGDIRVNLDLRFIREGFGKILSWFWDLTCMFAPPEQFFRVTGDDAPFETKNGFAKMTAKERGSSFDFDIKLATSTHSKEARKQEMLQLIAVMVQAPLFASSPVAQWQAFRILLRTFGEKIEDYLPKPQELPLPVDPKVEWQRMLQGEDVHVNSLDQARQHLETHKMQFFGMRDLPPEDQDPDALNRLVDHMFETEQQITAQDQAAATLRPLLQTLMAARQGGGDEQIGPEQPGAQDPLGGLGALMGGGMMPGQENPMGGGPNA